MKLIYFLEICEGIVYEELRNVLQYAFNIIKIGTPILIVVMIIFDLISAASSGKEEDMKNAQSKIIKRLIVGAVIFFLPIIVEILLNLIGRANGTCGIG